MRGTRNYEFFFLLIFFSEPLGVLLLPGLAGGRSRTQRDIHCRENQEYLHGNICCLNCPAGTRLESPCTTAGRMGKCVECDDGTYTSHSNSLRWCIGCTKCREDQQIVKPCIHTQDAECQCKPGRFCVPAEACEVCKKCSSCGKDEVAVRNCTPTANTECKKIQPNSDSSSANIPLIVIVIVVAAVAVVFVGVLLYWKRCRSTDSQRELAGRLKDGQLYSDNCSAEEGRNGESQMLSYTSLILPRPLVRAKPFTCVEDERKVLCESLDSSASNSQHSLTGLPLYAAPLQPDERVTSHSEIDTSPLAGRRRAEQATANEEKQFPTLVPVNGEESLRKCFEYFEEIDIDCHRRFFRHLGISDNVIKSKDGLPYDDKIHDLLNVWVEKEGIGASINDLLRALLDLNQRLTAERVKDKAILNDHYLCEE